MPGTAQSLISVLPYLVLTKTISDILLFPLRMEKLMAWALVQIYLRICLEIQILQLYFYLAPLNKNPMIKFKNLSFNTDPTMILMYV